ncbi:MaoC family dehydratase [Alcaligenaceae bacterium]|nr:MaoC family dehydratase [Alcaligenaceae bacterium]
MPDHQPCAPSAIRPFDSVQSLVDFAGQPAIVSSALVIDQKMIDQFAQLTHDKQWIHVDRERAVAESPYGSTIAHGFLVLSLLSYWQASCITFPNANLVLNYGFDKIRYISPVPSGSSVSAAFALAQVTLNRPGEARCSWKVTVGVQDAPRPSVHADWQILVRYGQG